MLHVTCLRALILRLERFRITFMPNGKRRHVWQGDRKIKFPFALHFIYSKMLVHASFIHTNYFRQKMFLSVAFLIWEIFNLNLMLPLAVYVYKVPAIEKLFAKFPNKTASFSLLQWLSKQAVCFVLFNFFFPFSFFFFFLQDSFVEEALSQMEGSTLADMFDFLSKELIRLQVRNTSNNRK